MKGIPTVRNYESRKGALTSPGWRDKRRELIIAPNLSTPQKAG